MFILIGIAVAMLAFVGWEVWRTLRHRKAAERRRERSGKRVAYSKAWDMVFGRRLKRRLTFEPTKREDGTV